MNALVALALLAIGCKAKTSPAGPTLKAQSTDAKPWFVDATAEVGLDFVHDARPLAEDRYFMPRTVGSGVALFDFDNDGRLDLYLLQNGGPDSGSTNRLFHQGADGRFTDVSAGSGLDIAGHGMGVAVGDINNDGWNDLLVTEYGRARLFVNQGNGTFSDATSEAGIDNPHWGTSAAFVDYDRDGWLDLVIANYVDYDPTKPCGHRAGMRDFCGPSVFLGTVTKLFRNEGNAAGSVPRFKDVTVDAGLAASRGPGLGVVCADFDGDGWPDILIANDGQPNRLWINQRNGTFTDEAAIRAVAYNGSGHTQANMGIAIGDVDGDGLFDLFVSHLTEESHILLKQGPRGYFRDMTGAARLMSTAWRSTGFGTVMGDFNQDGAIDLAMANGRVARDESRGRPEDSEDFWKPYTERNQLFANDGSGRFRDISVDNDPFCGTPGVYRSLAMGDIDGDGALDLVVTEVGGRARLLYNRAANRGHWLMVRAVDPSLGGRDALGASITVEVAGRQVLGLINAAHSYLSSNDPRAHFGLGREATVDSIHVAWPDGSRETFIGTPADRLIVLRKGEGRTIGEHESPPPTEASKGPKHE